MDSLLLLLQKYQEGDVVTKYCHKIASYLSERDIETHLVCFGEQEKTWERDGLKIHEFPFQIHGDNFFSWTMLIQTEFTRKIRELVNEKNISLVHVNDWLTVPAALIAKNRFQLPFIVTYHSIEEERGMGQKHSQQISNLEWQGTKESSYVIVHEEKTREAMEVFDLPDEKVKFFSTDSEGWKDKIFDIYQQVENLSPKKPEDIEDKNENFNAYMGVSSA